MRGSWSLNLSNQVKEARAFSIAAHSAIGQLRKFPNAVGAYEPYWFHCQRVAETVAAHEGDLNMVCAAWLHDTVEDTQVTLNIILGVFGPDIGGLVADLTDISVPEDGNRATRKAIDRAHSIAGSARSQTIKLADLLDNSKSILLAPDGFAKVYVPEKKLILEGLTKGNEALRRACYYQIEIWESQH